MIHSVVGMRHEGGRWGWGPGASKKFSLILGKKHIEKDVVMCGVTSGPMTAIDQEMIWFEDIPDLHWEWQSQKVERNEILDDIL